MGECGGGDGEGGYFQVRAARRMPSFALLHGV